MTPISDGARSQRYPVVTVSLIVANFAVWLLYELPDLNEAIRHASFYPCTVNDACERAEPWGISWITAMFLHASWGHILGNMLFLAVFGRGVEAAFGRLQYLVFYFAGGFAATMAQTGLTLAFESAKDARVPTLGASGAISAVLGAYLILYPREKIVVFLYFFPLKIPAWLFLGAWFVYQLVEAYSSLFVKQSGEGVAFFAHIGGFVFGMAVAIPYARAQRARA
jgi:membrane associated rhomboid family serine protease